MASALDNAIYLGMKNDVSFLLDDRMTLYEHQSTWNPNMPLRNLFYIARLLEKHISAGKRSMYSSSLIRIPAPHFVVFYNGQKPVGEDITLKLSDEMREQLQEEFLEEGREEGKAQFLLLVLNLRGTVPKWLKDRILCEKDSGLLESWMKTAADAVSVEDFLSKTGLKEPILCERNSELLQRWMNTAADAVSVEDFLNKQS